MYNKMYENVKSLDYTKKFLQSDSDPATMEVVTRTNAVKSPTNSPETVSYTHLCPPSAGLQRNQWCTFSFLPQQRFSLSGAEQMINVCAYHASLLLRGASAWRIC